VKKFVRYALPKIYQLYESLISRAIALDASLILSLKFSFVSSAEIACPSSDVVKVLKTIDRFLKAYLFPSSYSKLSSNIFFA